jgi:hypothetical protein
VARWSLGHPHQSSTDLVTALQVFVQPGYDVGVVLARRQVVVGLVPDLPLGLGHGIVECFPQEAPGG